MPTLTYLAPIEADKKPRKGEILSFEADTMPLFPEGHDPYKKEVESGTLIKLYDYNLSNTGHILRRNGLLYKMDLLLPDPALPLLMHECRPRIRGKGEVRTQETPMSGMLSRLRDNKNLEEVEPDALQLTIGGRQLIARVFAFKTGKGSTYRKNEGVILTLNGQTHSADIKTGFFANKKVGLGSRIAKDLLVVIDCSALDANERDELFMTSRDSVAEDSDIFKELKKVLRKLFMGTKD